jgi:hypothetical protein
VYKRQHGITAAEIECSYLGEDYKEFQKNHIRVLSCEF